MLFKDESSKESGGLEPVMKRLKCQKKEENTVGGELVERNQVNEQLKFSCPTHCPQSLDILPQNGRPSRRMAFPKHSLKFRNGPYRSNETNPCPLLSAAVHVSCALLILPAPETPKSKREMNHRPLQLSLLLDT